MDILGTAHLGLALAAIGFGAMVMVSAKGTRVHRWLGRCYGVAMLGLNATALLIYDLFGTFGPFHWLALASLATLIAGLTAAWRRRPAGGWVRMHAEFMSWSYVGLLAAAVAETASRIPGAPFAGSVIAASLVVLAIGGIVLRARLPAAVQGAGRRRHRSD